MKVKVIYRNYIPLYSFYSSFWEVKNPKINYTIDNPNQSLLGLFKLYRKIKSLPLANELVKLAQNILFEKENYHKYDALFFTGIVPNQIPSIPFVIDFEHIIALFNFIKPDKDSAQKVWRTLIDKNCIAILPWSKVAEKTLRDFYGDKFNLIKNKVRVVYPALPIYKDRYKANYSILTKDEKLKILFVGKDYERKGLLELIESLKKLDKTYQDKFEFYVVSDYASKEDAKNFHFFEAKFSHQELIEKFFLNCDVFIMPTRHDSFGMVLLEALACGMPIISTKQFAIKEFLKDGINGYYVDSNELVYEKDLKYHFEKQSYIQLDSVLVRSLMERLMLILDNPQEMKRLKNNTIKIFKGYSSFNLKTRDRILEDIFYE